MEDNSSLSKFFVWLCVAAVMFSSHVTVGDAAALTASQQVPMTSHQQFAPQVGAVDEKAWEQELSSLKEQILNQVAGDIESAWRDKQMNAKRRSQEAAAAFPAQKRMFVPVPGVPGEGPTIKREIRYHQCYFNPISCFK